MFSPGQEVEDYFEILPSTGTGLQLTPRPAVDLGEVVPRGLDLARLAFGKPSPGVKWTLG